MNPFDSTDLDREQSERIDPEHTKHLTLMFLSAVMIGIIVVFLILIALLNADSIDRFFSSMKGLKVLTGIFLVLAFVVWRVKKWMN